MDNIQMSEMNKLNSFITLLKEKNPELSVELHYSDKGFPEEFSDEYKNGIFAAQAHKNSHAAYVLKVSEDYDLPFESYEDLEFRCSSWRNNNYTGGLPESISEKQKAELPSDLDVVIIQGNPLAPQPGLDVSQLAFYTVGGCAKEISRSMSL